MIEGWVYLIHLDRPLSPDHTCQHYLGWALAPYARLNCHRAGLGARMLQVAVERGIGFRIVRLWPGGRELERQLKAKKCAPLLCPVCAQMRHRWQLSFALEFSLADVPPLEF
jgi:hypothetical protein